MAFRKLKLDQPVLDSEAGQISIVPQVEFFQQPVAVSIHRLDTEMIGLGDFSGGLAQGQMPEHLDLPVG